MVIVTIGEHKYAIDGYLVANLEHLKRNVKKDYDAFVLVTGREGYGKSTIAAQIALYVDPTYNIDRCCFTADQFLEAVFTAEKYQAIVFDETMGYLSGRGAMSKFNKVLIKVMSEMRSKNLFVILCIPNFFMMDWYVAYHRTTGLIHTYRRTCFASYDYAKKQRLWIKGKRDHNYHAAKPNYIGRFIKYFPLDKEAYEAKKQLAINSFNKEEKKGNVWKEQRNKLSFDCLENNYYTKKQLSDVMGVSLRSITEFTKEMTENNVNGDAV